MTRAGPETIFRRDGLPTLAKRLEESGARRVLLLAPPSRRLVERVSAELGAFQPAVFDGAAVHVPVEVVERAAQALASSQADTLVALGGGSAIGLGKALRLTHEVRFVAIPTTYSGSEMTSMYGTTRGAEKTTGRDPRVRPDLVLYDAALSAALPIGLSVQSLMNAFAHLASVLSTGSLSGDDRAQALTTASALLRASEDLLLAPGDVVAREAAQRAASAAGALFDLGKSGEQHQLAHLLGGALGLPHAALHAVLLPQFLAFVRARDAGTAPALVDELEQACGVHDLETHLHDLLSRAAAPLSLEGLKADPAAVKTALATRPELPAIIALDALQGLRPTRQRLALGEGLPALLAGPPLEKARRVVLALHGRGAEAGGIVRRYREIAGHDPEVAILGLRNEQTRWYAVKYLKPGAGADAEVLRAVDKVRTALAEIRKRTAAPLVLAGFSQGACLALETAARHGGVAAVIGPCGGRIGPPAEWPAGADLTGIPVLLGAAAEDKFVDRANLEATAAWFRGAGAAVEVIGGPGDRHDISTRQRLRARELIRGQAAAPGQSGLGNALSAEALPGALPAQQNSPRLGPYGLYAEQVNATAFTARRGDNQRVWLYRVRPSTQRRALVPLAHPRFGSGFEGRPPEVNLAGWAPLQASKEHADFVDGLVTLGGAGSAALRRGYAIHLYSADRDMERRAFTDADGDLLLVPETGALTVLTELGPLEVAPGQLLLLPRGLAFSVHLHGPLARGYMAESFGRHFQLPERGPIGANGLADPRHFHAPAAWYEDKLAPDFRVVTRLGGRLYEASQDHSPFDVVAWHGNHAPFVYSLDDFSPVSGVRFDHTDPSVYTVLTAPLDEPGANALDLIVFPPRWDVSEGTFRPPFFHRNTATELNGIIREQATHGPFQQGCSFLTPPMTPHGPSGSTVERIRAQSDEAADRHVRQGVTGIWFQFESVLPFSLTPWAEEHKLPEWAATWGSHRSHFEP